MIVNCYYLDEEKNKRLEFTLRMDTLPRVGEKIVFLGRIIYTVGQVIYEAKSQLATKTYKVTKYSVELI